MSGRRAPREVVRPPREARPPLSIALRIAARNARRSLGRSILIVAMIAVPVTGMAATAVVVSSSNPTARELVDLHLGEAEAIAQVVGAPGSILRQGARAPVQGWAEQVPPADGSGGASELIDPTTLIDGRIVVAVNTFVTIESEERLRQVQAVAGDVFIDELAGRYALLSGRAPSHDREIVVSPALAADLSLSLGSVVETQPDGVDRTVVGIGRSTHDAADELRVFGSIAGLDVDTTRLYDTIYFVIDEALSWDDVLALNEQGIAATSRDIILGDGPYPGAAPDDLFGSAFGFQGQYLALAAMIGGFLLLQVVLLAGAAFMVGARQQQRSLAVLASVGGDRRLMRSVVTAGGIVLGGVGSVVGIALGIGAGAAFIELSRTGSATQYPGFHLDPILLGATAIAATAAGWLAAVIPARIATRVDIVSALRGARRPAVARTGARRLALAVLVVGGAVLAGGGVLLVVLRTLEEYPQYADGVAVATIALGAVVLQLGVILALPMVLRRIARVTSSARTSVRLATRDSARNSGRTVPVAAAVMTTVFLASFLMSAFGAAQVESERWYRFRAPMDSVMISARSYDAITNELRPVDDVGVLLAGVAEIADAEATLIEGVYMRENWGFDEVSGQPLLPPEGTAIVMVALDPAQVCPSFFGPSPLLSEEESRDWQESMTEDPRCSDQSEHVKYWVDPAVADSIRVGSLADLEAATGMTLDGDSKRVLLGGGVVALAPAFVADGMARIRWIDAEEVLTGGSTLYWHDAVREETPTAIVQEPPSPVPGALLMLPETAGALDLAVTPLVVIAYPDTAPGAAERDALLELSRDVTGNPWALQSGVETGPPDIIGTAAWALVGVSGAIALTASAIAIGLARIDGRRDEAILGAIGATRRLRRAVSFWQAVLLAGIGTVVGAGLGLLAAGALALPGGPMPFAPPWGQLGVAAIGVPLVIALGAWLFAGRATALPTDRSAIA